MTVGRKRWAGHRCRCCKTTKRREDFLKLPDGKKNPNCRYCVEQKRKAMLRTLDARERKASAWAPRAPQQKSFTAHEGP